MMEYRIFLVTLPPSMNQIPVRMEILYSTSYKSLVEVISEIRYICRIWKPRASVHLILVLLLNTVHLLWRKSD